MDVRGMTIVLNGRFRGWTRSEAKRRLEELGARVTETLSGRTDLVFTVNRYGSTYEEAVRRNLPILNDSAFASLLADGSDSRAADDGFAPGEESDLVALRTRLLKLEREQGITEEHRAATREVRAMEEVCLRHPYGHEAEINDYALSPCGRYLATGTSLGDDHEAGGTLQIWEVATGRCVSVLRGIDGGIGWPGHDGGIQWSADSRRIGLAYNTNWVGVFDPFSSSLDGYKHTWAHADAKVADHAARPRAWALAPDAGSAFVASDSPCEVGGCVVPFLKRSRLSWTIGRTRPSHPFLLAERLREDLRNKEEDAHDDAALRADRVRWSRDGTRLLAQGEGRGRPEAFVVDVASGQPQWVAEIGRPADWSPDDRLLAHDREGLCFLDALTGEPTREGPGHQGVTSLRWGMRGDVPRLAAQVGEGNAAGAEPGVLIYDADRFRHRLDVTPVAKHRVSAHSWAWSPSGDAGAWLTADGRAEVWSLTDDAPRRLRTLDVPVASGALLWCADDVLIALGPTTLRFLHTGSGEILGDFTFLRTPQAPKHTPPTHWMVETHNFAPDDTTWCAAFSEGVVIAPDGRGPESLDAVLAWTVRDRLAWPARWGELDVVRTARTARERLELLK
ncbi:BRCT domain-containing protein [Streptomyces sp. NPDC050636]|uniref:WD40 repeat domain-containing protein n=1 Tax=Streptomyces sp. NPDC050636 TaxID=3154510 RepID=UPI0034137891